jgi:hypothetical protein
LRNWFLVRLFVIPAIISLALCLIVLPLFSALRNLALYNYFPLDTFWADVPYLLLFGFGPVFVALIPITALGLWIYLKVRKNRG